MFLSDFHLRTEQLNKVFILPKVGSTFTTTEKSSVPSWARSACTINDAIGKIFGNKVSEKRNGPIFFHIDVHGSVTVKKIFIHMDIDYNYNRSVIYVGQPGPI